jgi:flavodoxin
MRTIIIYNTATGNTRAIANKMKEILTKYNHECDVYRDKDIKKRVKNNPHYFDSYDILCLGSCTHGAQPALSFISFIENFKNYKLEGKNLVCFSSSASPNGWKETCKKIRNDFPEMNHIGNFGCSLRFYDSTIRSFEGLIKTLN